MKRHLGFPLAAALFALAAPAAAQEQGALSFGLGIVKPEDVDSTLWVTANYRFHLTDRLSVEPEVGYWKKSEKAGALEASLEDLSLGANLIYRFPGQPLNFWVGGGLGAHLVKGSLRVGGGGSEDTDANLGIHLLGGLDYELSDQFSLFGALRQDLVQLEGDVDLNQTKLYGGLRYRF